MKKLNEATTIANLENDEYVSVVLSDGTLGKIRKTDLLPIVSSIKKQGLIDRSKFMLHDTYRTESITYRALKITTNIALDGYKTVMFDICIMSYCYSGVISFALKVHLDTSINNVYAFNKNLDGIESIYVYNENGRLSFTINFKGISLNISNGVISAICYAVRPGKVDYENTITSISEDDKYTSGTSINEIKVSI